MSAQPCEFDGCDRPSEKKGQCRRHYDRERESNRTDRITPRRYARARAWKRAATRLVALHRDEFERILAEEKAKAFEETERLVELATAAGVKPHDGIARLRPGPVPEDEEPHERLLLDPGRCPQCSRVHDHGHRCPFCSADLTDWTAAEDQERLAILHRMRCVNCGKDGTRRGEPCRDLLAGRRWTRHDMRLAPSEASA